MTFDIQKVIDKSIKLPVILQDVKDSSHQLLVHPFNFFYSEYYLKAYSYHNEVIVFQYEGIAYITLDTTGYTQNLFDNSDEFDHSSLLPLITPNTWKPKDLNYRDLWNQLLNSK